MSKDASRLLNEKLSYFQFNFELIRGSQFNLFECSLAILVQYHVFFSRTFTNGVLHYYTICDGSFGIEKLEVTAAGAALDFIIGKIVKNRACSASRCHNRRNRAGKRHFQSDN